MNLIFLIFIFFNAKFAKAFFKFVNPFASKNKQQDNIDILFQQILEIQKITSQQNLINSKKIEELIDYNQNRDRELEIIIENKLYNFLKDEGWKIFKVNNIRQIYDSEDKVLTDLDGLLYGSHTSYPGVGFYFFLEVKQIFTIKKYNKNFKTKVTILENILDEIPSKKSLTKRSEYKKMCDAFYRYKRMNSDYKLVGIVGSPSIDPGLQKILVESKVSTIVCSADQYSVNLVM